MEQEIWKPIPDYPKYEASSLGRIASLDYMHTGKRHLMSLVDLSDGYKGVKLWNEKGKKCWRVHRLIALTFIPNPNNYPIVNHKDRNPHNNQIDNLEWCTVQYNVTYADAHIRHGLAVRGENHWFHGKHHSEETKRKIGLKTKLQNPACKSTRIRQYDLEGNLVAEYLSAKDASRKTNIPYHVITNYCTGNSKNGYGYIWKREKIK